MWVESLNERIVKTLSAILANATHGETILTLGPSLILPKFQQYLIETPSVPCVQLFPQASCQDWQALIWGCQIVLVRFLAFSNNLVTIAQLDNEIFTGLTFCESPLLRVPFSLNVVKYLTDYYWIYKSYNFVLIFSILISTLKLNK